MTHPDIALTENEKAVWLAAARLCSGPLRYADATSLRAETGIGFNRLAPVLKSLVVKGYFTPVPRASNGKRILYSYELFVWPMEAT